MFHPHDRSVQNVSHSLYLILKINQAAVVIEAAAKYHHPAGIASGKFTHITVKRYKMHGMTNRLDGYQVISPLGYTVRTYMKEKASCKQARDIYTRPTVYNS